MENEIIKCKIEFNRILSNLQSAPYNLWINQFKNLMEFCENDSIIRSIISSFKPKSNISGEEWYKIWEASDSRGKRSLDKVGYDCENFGLTYKILKYFYNNSKMIRMFCQDSFKGGGQGERFSQFYSQMISPIDKKINMELDNKILEHKTVENNKEKRSVRKMNIWIKISILAATIAALAAVWIAFFKK